MAWRRHGGSRGMRSRPWSLCLRPKTASAFAPPPRRLALTALWVKRPGCSRHYRRRSGALFPDERQAMEVTEAPCPTRLSDFPVIALRRLVRLTAGVAGVGLL